MEINFFISQDGTVPKRKHTSTACENCRKKKKRCHHDKTKHSSVSSSSRPEHSGPSQYPPGTSYNLRSLARAPASLQNHDVGGSREPQQQEEREAPRLHIGDLNPVVFFVDDTSTRLVRGRTDQRDCGIWLDRDNELLVSSNDGVHSEKELSPSSTTYQASQQRAYILQEHPLLPLQQSQEVLVDIYFRRVHPILPLIDESDFRIQFKKGSSSPYLVQAICLVASKDHEARSYLRLSNQAEPISISQFADKLYRDLSKAVSMKLEKSRVTLIQIYALLSLHVSGPGSFEEASMCLTQAIHHAFTIGLHLTKLEPTQHNRHIIRLFWCLWSLDRWNAAIHGRPLVIHNGDLGQQLTDVIPIFKGAYRVFLCLALTLSEVIKVYRPVLEIPIEENKPEIPRFEDIMDDCGGDISLDEMLFLELAYHAIALLASRPWGLKVQPRSHTLYLRQDLSVYRMATLTQMCDVRQLAPLPIVPYSISLGFSVSYKQIKRCQLPSTQHTAKQHLQAFYKNLDALCPMWWAAQVMTRLGQRALNSIYREDDKTNDQVRLNPLPENRVMNRARFSGCGDASEMPGIATRLHSRTIVSEEAEERRSQPAVSQTATTNNSQLSFDFTDMDNDILNGSTADLDFCDIDNLLTDFLDINIPTCPSHPSFNNLDTAWGSEGSV